MAEPRVSSIPFRPAKERAKTASHASSGVQVNQNASIDWVDLTRQPIEPTGDDLDHLDDTALPEDHLEDLLNLPLGQDLKSKRSKTSLASTAISQNGSTLAFPASHDVTIQNSDLPTIINRPARKDSLRKRAQSTPMQPSSSGHSGSSSASAASSVNKKHRRLDNASPTAASPMQSSTSPKAGPSSTPTPRSRAVTNNVNPSLAPKKSPTASSSTARRPLQSTKPAAGRQNSTPLQKKGTSSSPARSRSQSTSRQNGNTDSAFYSQFDADSKPPWLDQSSTPLYRSDISAPEPGSLADLARHAQSKHKGAAAGVAGSIAMEEAGNTSTRSWDDVILPAVAKQIRAQQMLEAQQREAQEAAAGASRPKRTEVAAGNAPAPAAAVSFPAMLPPELQHNAGPPQLQEQSQPSPSMYLQPSGSRSFRERTSSRPPPLHPAASNLSLAPSSTSHSARTHHTGRQELWQQSGLASPTTAMHNGFGQAQSQAQAQPQTSANLGREMARPTTAKSVQAGFSEKSGQATVQADDEHGKKGCCCIVM